MLAHVGRTAVCGHVWANLDPIDTDNVLDAVWLEKESLVEALLESCQPMLEERL